MNERRKSIALLLCLLLWFLACARKGIAADFHPDDLMNLNRALTELRGLRGFFAPVWPYTSIFRPVGALYYKAVYLAFGPAPLAFRCVTYAFMALNVALAYRLGRLLSGSVEIGFLAAMLWAYHHRLVDIYFNNGTVYDVLCFTFYAAALVCYVAGRQRGHDLSWRRTAAILLFFILALNAKETAATLPAVLAAWELIYLSKGATRPWRVKGVVLALAAMLVMSAIASVVKAGPHTSLYGNPDYQNRLSVAVYLRNMGSWLDDLTLRRYGFFTPVKTILLLATATGLAAISRKKAAAMGCALALIAALPVSFINTRGLYAVYIAYFGWTLLAASCLVSTRDWLLKRAPAAHMRNLIPAATALLLAVTFLAWQKHDIYRYRNFREEPDRERIRLTLAELNAAHVCPRPGGRILFLRDRWPPNEYGAIFATRLVCRDSNLNVDLGWRLAVDHRPLIFSDYDSVIDYSDGRMVVRRGTDAATFSDHGKR
jgi:hypothetical protein